jgi:hypothetical protein
MSITLPCFGPLEAKVADITKPVLVVLSPCSISLISSMLPIGLII